VQYLHGKLQNLHPLRPQTMQNLHPFRGINVPTVESCYRTFWGYASKEPNVQKTVVFEPLCWRSIQREVRIAGLSCVGTKRTLVDVR
jgi:hypothetical protein